MELQWGLGFLAEEGHSWGLVLQLLEKLQWGLGFLAEEGSRLVTSLLPSGCRDVFEGSLMAGSHTAHVFLSSLQIS